jgi:hypothetical protein
MAVETDIERLVLLNDFGISVELGGTDIIAIFENDYNPVDAGGEVQFSIQQAMILCRTSDASGAAEGTTAVINGNNYVVTDIQPYGQGMSMLVLEAQ